MSAPIQVIVLAIRLLDGRSSVKAFVDLKLVLADGFELTLKGCKIVQQDGQKAWLALQSSKTDRGWQNLAEATRPLREHMAATALPIWEQRTAGITAVHQIERPADPRQERADELAARFDQRGPDGDVPW